MDSQLKQRLVGAAVLVALAVIFLPMLVKGPAPDSGVSDVPLRVPDAPDGDMQTRDLPLVVPGDAPAGGALGMQSAPADGGALPTVDTAAADAGPVAAGDRGDTGSMLPASVAGGDYAVHFAAYASSVGADTVVNRLREAKLPAYREATSVAGKPAWRVRIGPYATRADAELARIEAVKVGQQAGAKVVALDSDAAEPASASQAVAAKPEPPAVIAQALPPAAKPATDKPATDRPVAAKPVETPKPATPQPTTPKPAAASVGFAVQVGVFGNPSGATSKRDQLRAAGFRAFTETVNTDKGPMTRVLAGPVVSRAEADQLKAQVKSKTGTDGMVRPHP